MPLLDFRAALLFIPCPVFSGLTLPSTTPLLLSPLTILYLTRTD